jgi:methionyl-tRNA formyltransferase
MTAGLSVVFAGTPDFSVPALEAIAASRHRLLAVYTQPDRRSGRGLKVEAGPVRRAAEARGIPVEQPATLKDPAAQAALAARHPDVMVVVAYGLILPQAVLDIPRLGCVNIHASLLPRWRGAAPIQRAIAAGDRQTGITIMRMEAGLDTGPMLSQEVIEIAADETGGSLHDRLAVLGARMIVEALDRIEAGTARFVPQDDSRATYAGKLSKAEAILDWSQSAEVLERQVRAFDPWPVAQTLFDGDPVRVWSAQALEETAPGLRPGTVVRTGKEGIEVACGQGRLRITRLQPPGKRPMTAGEFLNARRMDGALLG